MRSHTPREGTAADSGGDDGGNDDGGDDDGGDGDSAKKRKAGKKRKQPAKKAAKKCLGPGLFLSTWKSREMMAKLRAKMARHTFTGVGTA